jgi:SAM-dependent methyltransferase
MQVGRLTGHLIRSRGDQMTTQLQPTETAVTPDGIFQIAAGFMAAKHLFVAAEIDLFAQLAGGSATLDDLSARTGIPRRTVRISADAMVALGLVERSGDEYRNAPAASAFLSGQGPADLRPIMRFWNRISYPTWEGFEQAIRRGEARNRQGGGFSEVDQPIFSEGVGAFAEGPAQALADSYDFSRHHRILDLGGGIGSLLVAVLRRHAGLQGNVFELPGAAAVARQHVAREPEGTRIEVTEGDFLTDPVPPGHDAIVLANVVHVLSEEHNRALLQRARAAVTPGARLLIVDLVTDPTHTQPPFAALMAGEFLMIAGEGDVYSEDELRGWLRDAGWQPLVYTPLTGPTSLLVSEAR